MHEAEVVNPNTKVEVINAKLQAEPLRQSSAVWILNSSDLAFTLGVANRRPSAGEEKCQPVALE